MPLGRCFAAVVRLLIFGTPKWKANALILQQAPYSALHHGHVPEFAPRGLSAQTSAPEMRVCGMARFVAKVVRWPIGEVPMRSFSPLPVRLPKLAPRQANGSYHRISLLRCRAAIRPLSTLRVDGDYIIFILRLILTPS